jgi:hypothetical protein
MAEERLLALEKQNRRLRTALWALTGVIAIVAVVAAMPLVKANTAPSGDSKEIRTERLVIVDGAGNAIGRFGRDENGGFIQVGGGESLVTIMAGKVGSVVAQHGNQMCYMSADRDVCLFKIASPNMEAAIKSTTSMDESAFWISSHSKGRVYLGLNKDYGASGFLRSEKGENSWDASEKKPRLP